MSKEESLRAVLKSCQKKPEQGSQNVSQALRELGSYLDSQSRYPEALECYNENMAIWKKNQRNRAYSASTESNAYHDISLTYKYMENFPEAVRYGKFYLDIIEDSFGKKSELMGVPLINLWKIYGEMKATNEQDACRTQLESLSASHPSIRQLLANEVLTLQQARPVLGKKSALPAPEIIYHHHYHYNHNHYHDNKAAAALADQTDTSQLLSAMADPESMLLYRRIERLRKEGKAEQAEKLILENFGQGVMEDVELYQVLGSLYLEQGDYKKFAPTYAAQLQLIGRDVTRHSGQMIEPEPLIELFRNFDNLPEEQQTVLIETARRTMQRNEMPFRSPTNRVRNSESKRPAGAQVREEDLMSKIKSLSQDAKRTGAIPCWSPMCRTVTYNSADFKTCSRCMEAMYCNKECQKTHWKTHKSTCMPPKSTVS